jgi:hypothetical protein
MLNLAILKEYDYFLKIDTDVVFVESFPFHLLQDMAMKNAVFGHTAEYHLRGSKTCAMKINAAMVNFTETHPIENTSRPIFLPGMAPCAQLNQKYNAIRVSITPIL